MIGAGMGTLFALLISIAQWVGVIGLSKSGRNGAWWCMAIGTGLTTIGSLLSALATVLLFRDLGRLGGVEGYGAVMSIVAGGSGLGTLLFVIGFAMHGLRTKSVLQRVGELEGVIAAQGEQLDRQHSVKGS